MSVVVVRNGFRHAALKLAAGSAVAVTAAAALAAQRARSRAPVRTGFLQGHIGSSGHVVRSEARYSGFVEHGTRKMAAEPYFFQSVREAEAVLRDGLAKTLRGL